MASKNVAAVVKIQIPAGQASPAPPVGTALGPHGIAIMDFCKAYNAQTESQRGTVVPVEITIFEDRSFEFITKTPPAPVMIREALKMEKASVELYAREAGKAAGAAGKTLYERLAAEERQHVDILQSTLEYLNDTGHWFLWDEQEILDGG